MRNIHLNEGNRGVTEHRSLLTHMHACVVTGNILGTISRIGMGDMGISLVQSLVQTNKTNF